MRQHSRFIHRRIWQLAFPMIVSNISTPLLGLVDTAVMGHLDAPQYLGGVALGGMIFSFLFWGFGFLRMGTTGLTAQAYGNENFTEAKAVLVRALLIAFFVGVTLIALQTPIRWLSFIIIDSSAEVTRLSMRYYDIRIWSSPATLCVYVITGWFVGMQNVKFPLVVVVFINLVNILLDYYLVVSLRLDISGVALASVLAEYSGLLIALLLLKIKLMRFKSPLHWSHVFLWDEIKNMLVINHHILVRTLCLIFSFAFFTVQSSKLGDIILAANTVLLNFQMFMAFALDGFAHAVGALVGKAIGAHNQVLLRQAIRTATLWSLLVALMFTGAYLLFGTEIITMLSDITMVVEEAKHYLFWLVILPLISFVCFLFDGIFIGATLAKEMRDSMIFATFCCYLPAWYFSQQYGNHGLWLALVVFMLARSLSMPLIFTRRRLI